MADQTVNLTTGTVTVKSTIYFVYPGKSQATNRQIRKKKTTEASSSEDETVVRKPYAEKQVQVGECHISLTVGLIASRIK